MTQIDTAKPGCYPVQYAAETETETVRACLTVIVEEGKREGRTLFLG